MGKRLVQIFIAILLVVAGLYALLLAALYFGQNWLIFPGGRAVWQTPADAGWPFEDLYLEVDGETTNAWYVPVEKPRGVVLFSHGNAGTMAGRLETIAVFRELRFSTLIYDYGGYGNSTGRSSEQRCYADIRAMWNYLVEERGFAPGEIVLFGRSLGGGPTCDLAAQVAPGAIILESTFLSVVQAGKDRFPFAPVAAFVKHRFDNASKVPRFQAPVLVMHSRDDDIIAYRHGERLYELAPEPKTFVELLGDHNFGWVDNIDMYAQALGNFLHPLFQNPEPEG
jgi:hypothetical protein